MVCFCAANQYSESTCIFSKFKKRVHLVRVKVILTSKHSFLLNMNKFFAYKTEVDKF